MSSPKLRQKKDWLRFFIAADKTCTRAQIKMASNSNEMHRGLQAETGSQSANPMF